MPDSLDRKECFKLYGGDKLTAKEPLSCKKSFSMGVVIPQKWEIVVNVKKTIFVENVMN